MKQQMKTIFGMLRSALLAVVTVAVIFGPSAVLAATNTANWDIGGTAQTASTINIYSYANGSVTLTKAAFLAADNSPLPDGSTVPQNTNVKFMIYVRNTNAFQMNDISISDIINPAEFTMVSASFQIDNSQSDVATEATIFGAVNAAATTASFGAADDVASYVGGTVNVGTTGGDTVLNIPANTTWAILFTATVL